MDILFENSKEYHLDNGFKTLESMTSAHGTVLEFVKEHGKLLGDKVIDLGCGNGALLAKICSNHPNVTPYGIDINERKLRNVGSILPDHSSNFRASDLYYCPKHINNEHQFTTAILSPGRLIEAAIRQRISLISWLQEHAMNVLCYIYPALGSKAADIDVLMNKAGIKMIEKGKDGLIAFGQLDPDS